MRLKFNTIFLILILIIVVQGCASRFLYRFEKDAQRPPNDVRFFSKLDTAVSQSGVRNGAYFQVTGFPYLRANRFLVSLKEQLESDAQRKQWVRLMQQLDISARQAEIQSLPAGDVQRLAAASGFEPERSILLARTIDSSDRLLTHDQRQPDFFEALEVAVQNSSEYSTLMRIVGLYPLAAIPVAMVTLRVNDEIAEWHQLPDEQRPAQGTLTTYGPADLSNFNRREVRKILERSRQNPLGIPLPSVDDRHRLLAIFAPVIIQDTTADYDRIGAVQWADEQLKINAEKPTAYYYFTHALYKGAPILQINYVIWYPARNGPNAPWIERGNIDGLTIRVSLDPGGDPFMVDIMNNCGCYQFFVPRQEKVQQILPSPLAIDAFVPTWLPDDYPRQRIAIRVISGWHQVQNIAAGDVPANAIRYRMIPYERLEMLKKTDSSRESMFSARGIGKFSERIESDIFIPMGVPLVGRMRQRGHHAIKFVGRAHFDDPHLFDKHFQFK